MWLLRYVRFASNVGSAVRRSLTRPWFAEAAPSTWTASLGGSKPTAGVWFTEPLAGYLASRGYNRGTRGWHSGLGRWIYLLPADPQTKLGAMVVLAASQDTPQTPQWPS